MSAEARLEERGYRLADPPPRLGRYVRAVSTGNLVYTAGHGPFTAEGATGMRGGFACSNSGKSRCVNSIG